MRFKAFSDKYRFDESVLEEAFPAYFGAAVSRWIYAVVDRHGLGFNQYSFGNLSPTAFKPEVWSNLQTTLRQTFPQELEDLYPYLFKNQDLLLEFLNILLQNYASSKEAMDLELHLAQGGSAYRVAPDGDSFMLEKRIPKIVDEASSKALSSSKILQEAWKNCYKHNPDYEKAVRTSVDFIEGYFRDIYWKDEPRTRTIYAVVKHFSKKPDKLHFKGSSFLHDPIYLFKLLEGVSNIRGEHTTGGGRKPTKDEAEYILHTVIYIWNLMQ